VEGLDLAPDGRRVTGVRYRRPGAPAAETLPVDACVLALGARPAPHPPLLRPFSLPDTPHRSTTRTPLGARRSVRPLGTPGRPSVIPHPTRRPHAAGRLEDRAPGSEGGGAQGPGPAGGGGQLAGGGAAVPGAGGHRRPQRHRRHRLPPLARPKGPGHAPASTPLPPGTAGGGGLIRRVRPAVLTPPHPHKGPNRDPTARSPVPYPIPWGFLQIVDPPVAGPSKPAGPPPPRPGAWAGVWASTDAPANVFANFEGLRGAGGTFFMLDQLQPGRTPRPGIWTPNPHCLNGLERLGGVCWGGGGGGLSSVGR